MLLVRLVHLLRDPCAAQAVDEGPALSRGTALLATQPARARAANAGSEEGVGHADLGAHGTNGLVSRW